MKALLDTHAFIWALSERSKLPVNVRSIIDDPDNTIYISAVSFWEIAIKVRNGRLASLASWPSTLIEAAEAMGFVPIPLTPNEASTHHRLSESTHFDPFDRMLIWQAIQRDMTLVSRDPEFKKFRSDGLRLLWK